MENKTHWLKTPKKNYFGVWDIPESGEITLTIKSAAWETIKDPTSGKSDNQRVVHFVEDYKPLICNQTNAKSIVAATGCKYIEDTVNKRITLIASTVYSRLDKMTLDCVRMKNEAPKAAPKPELLPATDNYIKVMDALKQGYTLEQVGAKYTISQPVIEMINKELESCKK